MNLNLFPFLILWGVLAVVVVALIVWRKIVSSHEDDFVHVMGDASLVTEQASVAHKLDVIDKLGKTMTAITVILGLALGALYLWQIWVQNSSLPSGQ